MRPVEQSTGSEWQGHEAAGPAEDGRKGSFISICPLWGLLHPLNAPPLCSLPTLKGMRIVEAKGLFLSSVSKKPTA